MSHCTQQKFRLGEAVEGETSDWGGMVPLNPLEPSKAALSLSDMRSWQFESLFIYILLKF